MSPTVAIEKGYKLRIYPNDHNPPHVHVIKDKKLVKVYLNPIEVMKNYGFNVKQVGSILKLVKKYQEELIEEWDQYPHDG